MKSLFPNLLCFLALSSLLIADDLKLSDGRVLKDYRILSKSASDVMVKHEGGVENVAYSKLPQKLQDELGYDPKQASQKQEQSAPANDSAKGSKSFKGIYAVDVYGNLESKGFSVEKLRDSTLGLSAWYCSMTQGNTVYKVDASGESETKVSNVRATITGDINSIDSKAAEFLGFVASLPYEGSSPNRARAWVESNIGRSASTEIGGVRFELKTIGNTGRLLLITPAS